MSWSNIKGIATYGCYEVRVTARVPSTSRPIRWAVFKVVDGCRVRLTPEGKDFQRFADAKIMAERVAAVVADVQKILN